METERFEELVAMTVRSLPEEFLERLDNIDILVAPEPTQAQMRKARVGRGYTLLGLYEGVPRTRRTSGYNFVLPDKITIFQKAIEVRCHSEEEIVAEIERVVKHEIAHHFGISDERLDELDR